jgi:hypothetical protein
MERSSVRVDIIANDIDTQCLILGSNLIRNETAEYNRP